MMAIAEHPVVYIGASVALQIIQGVPDRRTAGRRQVDVGIENDLLISRCHCTDGPAIGSGNQRTAQERASCSLPIRSAAAMKTLLTWAAVIVR